MVDTHGAGSVGGLGGVPIGDFSEAEYQRIKREALHELRVAYRNTDQPSVEELKSLVPDASRTALDKRAYATAKQAVLARLRQPK